jgi:glycosyltransferase involved in cell wall biosynthesis
MRTRFAIIAVGDFPGRGGGFDSFVTEFAPRAAQFCDVSVYTQEDQMGPPQVSCIAGVQRIGIYRPSGYRGLLSHRSACVKHAVQSGANAVYLLGLVAALAGPCNKVRYPKVTVLVNPDGMEWWRSGYQPWERIVLAGASVVAGLTADVLVCDAQAIARRYLWLRSRRSTLFMPYAVSADLDATDSESVLKSYGLVGNGYYLMVGRCIRENHISDVADWWSRAPTSKKLAIVTDTSSTPISGHSYTDELTAAAKESLGRIVLLGSIYDFSRLNSLRASAFAYIHGHSVGGTNPSLLESMASARPILAHDNEFNREVLGPAGLFFSDRDTLGTALLELERSEQLSEHYAQAVRERVERLYSWPRVMSAFTEQVLPIIARRARS